MRIDRILGLGQPTVSFEFFPPKTDAGFAALFRTIDELQADPAQLRFGHVWRRRSTRTKTVELVERIQRELGIRSMAHLTCVGHTAGGDRRGSGRSLGRRNCQCAGIARRSAGRADAIRRRSKGDLPTPTALVEYAAARHDFCIGVAGYPEGHPQCLNKVRDLEHLKRKVDNGAAFIVTQLFFDNADFYRFRDQARAIGIKVPIIAGIMPVSNLAQIKRFISMCGAKIPQPLLLKLESLESEAEAVATAGVAYATQQCNDLLANGVDGIHFYTLNKSKATVQICGQLQRKHIA